MWIRIRGSMPLRLLLMDPNPDSVVDPPIFAIELQVFLEISAYYYF
jgi:hypothetical protein